MPGAGATLPCGDITIHCEEYFWPLSGVQVPIRTACRLYLLAQLDYMERVLEALQEVQHPFEIVQWV